MKVKEDREIQRLNLKRKCYVILFKFVKCFLVESKISNNYNSSQTFKVSVV